MRGPLSIDEYWILIGNTDRGERARPRGCRFRSGSRRRWTGSTRRWRPLLRPAHPAKRRPGHHPPIEGWLAASWRPCGVSMMPGDTEHTPSAQRSQPDGLVPHELLHSPLGQAAAAQPVCSIAGPAAARRRSSIDGGPADGGGSLIQPGQKLLVPRRASSGPKTAATPAPAKPTKPTATPSSPSKPSAGDTTYVVRAGDTMSGIAQRYGVSLTKLLAANKLSSSSSSTSDRRSSSPVRDPRPGRAHRHPPRLPRRGTSTPARPLRPSPRARRNSPRWTCPAAPRPRR